MHVLSLASHSAWRGKRYFEVINKSLSKAGVRMRGVDYTVRAWSQHPLELALSWESKRQMGCKEESHPWSAQGRAIQEGSWCCLHRAPSDTAKWGDLCSSEWMVWASCSVHILPNRQEKKGGTGECFRVFEKEQHRKGCEEFGLNPLALKKLAAECQPSNMQAQLDNVKGDG